MDASSWVVPDASHRGILACAIGGVIAISVPAFIPGVLTMCIMVFTMNL